MFNWLRIFATVLFLSLFVATLVGLTVGANSSIITEDTIWTSANSPYIINEDLQIASGATLTIKAGVVVKVDSNKKIKVAGNLITYGFEFMPVRFTSNTDDTWGGIEFIDSTNSSINNTIIENASVAINLGGYSPVNFTGNIFRHNACVVTDTQGYQSMQFLNNTFSDNRDVFWGIRTLDESKFENNVFINNDSVFTFGYYFGHPGPSCNQILRRYLLYPTPDQHSNIHHYLFL